MFYLSRALFSLLAESSDSKTDTLNTLYDLYYLCVTKIEINNNVYMFKIIKNNYNKNLYSNKMLYVSNFFFHH